MKRRVVLVVFFGIVCLYAISCIYIFNLAQYQLTVAIPTENVPWNFVEPPGVCNCNYEQSQSDAEGSTVLSRTYSNMSVGNTCFIKNNQTSRNEEHIEMFDVLENMKLNYPSYMWTHNGWIQQMDTQYSIGQWDNESLIVHVVPFSHNDPGWTSTYEDYYSSWSKDILNVALNRLTNDPVMTFVWAEVIFLQRWYEALGEKEKEAFKKLLTEGRFEILTGGWVMTDEGVAHYAAMLDQLIEGHQWLEHHLGYKVKHGWSIDPFGHSPSMTYLLSQSGIKGMLIQRTHYAVKKHLAFKKQLEFTWKQSWDKDDALDSDIFCHVTPYMLYNIQYSCGPDINTCCQFDFTRKKCWKWGDYQPAEPITSGNVHEKSSALLDQLRKKSQFNRHNHVLFMIGDDFRFTSNDEWDQQFKNFTQLFSYMNSNVDMKVQVKFSTVGKYLDAARQAITDSKAVLPSLSGDFFTYSDRSDQYWSGYFTSRPMLKRLTRILQARLRAVEVLYSLTVGYAGKSSESVAAVAGRLGSWFDVIKLTRRELALCQHHDAITGTSKLSVVADYMLIVRRNLDRCRDLTGELSSFLVYKIEDVNQLKMLDEQPAAHDAPRLVVLQLENEHIRTVVVCNPLAVERQELVRLVVSSVDVIISDSGGKPVSCQVNPVQSRSTIMKSDQFEVYFEAKVSALGMSSYDVKTGSGSVPSANTGYCQLAKVSVFNFQHDHNLVSRFELNWDSTNLAQISNKWMTVNFCTCSRLMQSVRSHSTGIKYKVRSKFVKYGTGAWMPFQDKSGAYIFLPNGPAQEVFPKRPPKSVIIEGPLLSSVITWLPLMSQTITLYNNSEGIEGAGIHIDNTLDLHTTNNTELAMRLETSAVSASNDYYTDSNSFQLLRRRSQTRIPIQGNFYPMTSMAYLEGPSSRVTLLSEHSHGVASLSPGSIDVMLDRRLAQDDWRGLNEGVLDNVQTSSRFVLTLERRLSSTTNQDNIGYPSLLSQQLSNTLNNPLLVLSATNHQEAHLPFIPLVRSLPCDVHLLNLRVLGPSSGHPVAGDQKSSSQTVLLVLHRWQVDCLVQTDVKNCQLSGGLINLREFFKDLQLASVSESSLTGTQSSQVAHTGNVTLPRMKIKTYRITFT